MDLIIKRKVLFSKLLQLSLYPVCIFLYLFVMDLVTKSEFTSSVIFFIGTILSTYMLIYLLLLFQCKKSLLSFNKWTSFIFAVGSFFFVAGDFSKICIVLWVAFVVFSFYHTWSLSNFLNMPIFNPMVDKTNLFFPKNLKANFIFNNQHVVLMNWNDTQGYFAIKNDQGPIKMDEKKIMIELSGQRFSLNPEVVSWSRSNDGFGLIFNNSDEAFNWRDIVSHFESAGISASKMR